MAYCGEVPALVCSSRVLVSTLWLDVSGRIVDVVMAGLIHAAALAAGAVPVVRRW
jgi:hypothetical protein